MIKKIIVTFFIFTCSNLHAQGIPDFSNMPRQLQDVAEKMQQINTNSNQSNKTGSNNTGITCFVLDNENTRWATGGKSINSCNPATIERQITEPYGQVQIWQFINDREIKRSFIYSSKMRSNTNHQIYSYQKNGKRITENVKGCLLTWEILNETPNSITIKDIGATGSCEPIVRETTSRLSKMPPSTYKKING